MTPFSKEINVIWHRTMGERVALVEAPFTCDHCRRLSIAMAYSPLNPNDHSETAYRWGWSEQAAVGWVPKVGVGREYPDVPEHIAAAANEAHECHSIGAHRAAVMLARAVIEATAKDRGITTGGLFSKIEQMYDKNILREHIKEQAHEVRHLGNEMAHGDFVEPVSLVEADEVLELMAEVLHEVFQSHAKLQRRKEARLAKETGEQA